MCSTLLRSISPDTHCPPPSGTGGIGRQSVVELSRHNPAHIVFTGRNASAAAETIALAAPGLVSFLEIDQTSLASVASVSRTILERHPRIDVVICNAAIMIAPPALSKEGYVEQWAVNHLAHALMIRILLPALEATDAPRLVITTSKGQTIATAFDSEAVRATSVEDLGSGTLAPMKRYAQSKLANLVYGQELTRRHPRVMTVSVHPGVVRTGPLAGQAAWLRYMTYLSALVTQGGMMEPEQGAYNTLWAATAPLEGITAGAYYEPVGERGSVNKLATPEAGEALWKHTEEVIAPFLAERAAETEA